MVAGINASAPKIIAPVGQAGWPQQGQFDVVINRPEKADQWNRNLHPLLKMRMTKSFIDAAIGLICTGRTDAEEEYLVPLGYISFWRSLFTVQSAAREFEHPVTNAAVKVVVVSLAGSFIQCSQGRMIYLNKQALLDHGLQVPIDGGLIKCPDYLPARIKDLFDTHGPILSFKDYFQGCSLGCFSLHNLIL